MKVATYDSNPSLRAAIYGRVSTVKQDYAMQQHEVAAYVERNGWEATEYLEQASSRIGSKRKELERLLEDARLRKFDVVVVWKLDRFARSLKQLLENVQFLGDNNVRFISVMDRLDTDNQSPTGKLLMQILGSFAEFERNIIVERVRAGLDEAERRGQKFGRPRKVFDRDQALAMRTAGKSWRAIAAEMEVKVSTVRDAVLGRNRARRGCALIPKRSPGKKKPKQRT